MPVFNKTLLFANITPTPIFPKTPKSGLLQVQYYIQHLQYEIHLAIPLLKMNLTHFLARNVQSSSG